MMNRIMGLFITANLLFFFSESRSYSKPSMISQGDQQRTSPRSSKQAKRGRRTKPDKRKSVCKTPKIYFCDDFEHGSLENWDLLIDGYNLPSPGRFDILEEDSGKSLRFTAGTRGDQLYHGELILLNEAAMSKIKSDDYFVEYRIRPRNNSNTGNKYLIAMVRYQGPLQWYFGGMNLQNSSSSTQMEAGYLAESGRVLRKVQKAYPLEIGSAELHDGVWYNVRIDVLGSTITIYLNGELMGSFTDEESQFPSKGRIGFFTYNRSFEIDYIKVGDPSVGPAQLSIDYKKSSWKAAVDDPPLSINVTAIQSDKSTPDKFFVKSSDPQVLKLVRDGSIVSLVPQKEGLASISFRSGSDPGLKIVLDAEITPGFSMPDTIYGDLSGRLQPSPAASEEFPDTRLSLLFDEPPQFGSGGSIRIFRAQDDVEVDVIRLRGEKDTLGYQGQSQVRILNTQQVWTRGHRLFIAPHSHVLDYNTEYYVAISQDLLVDTKINGIPFSGLGKNSQWRFTTKSFAPEGTLLVVDDDGPADFRTVQGALNHVMKTIPKDTAVTIKVKNGDYVEPLYLRGKNKLTIMGESRDGTVISYENYDGLNSGTGSSSAPGSAPAGGRGIFLVEASDLLQMQQMTLHNIHQRSGSGDQAETLYFNSSGRFIAKQAAFISEQDTLLLKGYNWFYESLVAGNVDFIWGYSIASLFENSEIRSLGDSKPGAGGSGGYLVQARMLNETDPGIIFLNSTLTHGPGVTGNFIDNGASYLARSAGNPNYFDNVSFINCKMDTHIAPMAWAVAGVNDQPSPNPEIATSESGWREYGSLDLDGNVLDLSLRAGAYTLTSSEASAFIDREIIFSSYDNGAGWKPEP